MDLVKSLFQKGFVVRGCATAKLNGTYWPDKGAAQRDGWSRPYLQEGGEGTLEFRSGGTWYLSERYEFPTYYYCNSTSPSPPLTDWRANSPYANAPAPSLVPTTRRDHEKAAREAEEKARCEAAERARCEAAAKLRELHTAAQVDIAVLERAIASARAAGVDEGTVRLGERRLPEARRAAAIAALPPRLRAGAVLRGALSTKPLDQGRAKAAVSAAREAGVAEGVVQRAEGELQALVEGAEIATRLQAEQQQEREATRDLEALRAKVAAAESALAETAQRRAAAEWALSDFKAREAASAADRERGAAAERVAAAARLEELQVGCAAHADVAAIDAAIVVAKEAGVEEEVVREAGRSRAAAAEEQSRRSSQRASPSSELHATLLRLADDAGGLYDLKNRGVVASRFLTQPKELVFGQPAQAALGIEHYMCVSEEHVARGLADGVAAIQKEIEQHGSEAAKECLHYVLEMEAGSSDATFQDGLKRDCDADGNLLPSRRREDGRGMVLADFLAHPTSRKCGLTLPQVVGARLYTTAAYADITGPLRDQDRYRKGSRTSSPSPSPSSAQRSASSARRAHRASTPTSRWTCTAA